MNLIKSLVLALIILCPSFPALAAASPAAAPEAAQETGREKSFNAESFMLENGMQVVVIPNHRAPVLTHMVWYRVGGADEPRGLSGVAHYVEHLMFKGSENVPPGEFSRRVRALGGNDNAFTGSDFTAYHQSIASAHLETVMEMEADRMRGLLFPPEELVSERQVVIEERRQLTENDPRGYFREQLRASLFINHPYGTPIVGWLNELDSLEYDAVREFYERWYAPNNAILIVAGDVSAETLRPLAERIYGTIPPKDIPERQWTQVPPLPAVANLTMRHPVIRQPALTRMYRAPSLRQNKEEMLALQVLQNILSGGPATRLYRHLVVEQRLASNVSMSYSGVRWSDGTVGISAVPNDGISLEQLEQAIDQELRLLIAEGVSAQELEEAKTRMIDEAIFDRDSLTGPAMIFGSVLATGGTIKDVEYWPYDIQNVTAEQINAVAARYLDPDQFDMRPYVTGYLLPPLERAAPEPAAQEEAQP